MGKSKKDDDDLKKLKKLKKLLGKDKLRQELKKIDGKEQERKKTKKKSEDEIWEEKQIERTTRSEDHTKKQDIDKKDGKLQWMYKGADDLVDAEDYLLGKKVDQAIVKKQRGEASEKSQDIASSVGAKFDESETTQAVDMANKLREDPLFMIKQQELNKKKDLLNNPVQMKQLQELLKQSKQSKKKKKKKKHASSSDESSDSSSDQVKGRKPQGYGLVTSNQSKRIHDDARNSRHEDRHRRNSPDRRPGSHYRDRDSHRHRSPIRRHRSRSPVKSRDRQRSRSRSPRNRSSGSSKKMDAKELERRRAEMMDNAKARDVDRKNRVQQYRDEDRSEREAERNKSSKAGFIEPMKLSASSVEDRIKRNIYNIQRTSVALDKNFAKR